MRLLFACGLLCCLFVGCKNTGSKDDAGSDGAQLFHLLDSKATGIDFINEVIDEDSFNILTYRNFYNGGGVAPVDHVCVPDTPACSVMSSNLKLPLFRNSLFDT